MNKVIYGLVYGLLWILTLIPLGLLYLFSDLIFLIIYYLIPYRKKVVINNLKKSFPEKSDTEINKIARSFFRYFSDFLIETIKGLNITFANHARRVKFKNPELLDHIYDKGSNVVLVSGHYGNWEWVILLQKYIKHKFYYAAKILRSELSHKLTNKIRQQYGFTLIPMASTYRSVLTKVRSGERLIIWLLADQHPRKNTGYWTTFLNQDTAFFLGAARFVKKMNFDLVFMDIQRVKRGKYEVSFELLAEGDSELSETELTELHVRKLEEVITRKPYLWLWTHKRWKHKKPSDSE